MRFLKSLSSVIVITALLLFLLFNEQILDYVNTNYIHFKSDNIYLESNNYAKHEDYEYVKYTDDFVAKDFQDLLNIFYTILDSGTNEFTFYCDNKYKKCLKDIEKIVPTIQSEKDIISELNNFINPFNTYKNITLITTNRGKVTVKLDKLYNNEMIKEINNYIDNFTNEFITDDMDLYTKIKLFHDFLIDNTEYDKERASDVNNPEYESSPSHTAYGIVINQKALCGGYSDMMAIYLDRLGVKNIKVAADLHVWNLVFMDNKWLNLDVTWDDPVTNTGANMLLHEYFLIDNARLMELDSIEHNYDKTIYIEAN